MQSVFGKLQKVGKALMLPIAVMPAAAILLRLGAGVPGIEGLLADIMLKAGAGIFDNLYLLFGIGVALGLAKGNHGAAALAGAIGVLVCKNVYEVINPDINTGVMVGMIMGVIAGSLYNKYHDIKLPEFLGFFGGKRFVPIITSFVAVGVGILFGYVWPAIQTGIDSIGNAAIQAGPLGTFFFGFGNRLLIPVGLHHVLNSIFWFTFGSFTNAAGEVVNGDLWRYFAGDPTAGIYMAGWYPVMMFGLPAACFAMYRAAKPENRKAVGGMLFSIAFTSFLTGITEPIEFLFVYIAPGLYLVHAIMSGAALAITQLLGILHGFGFSAGLIDYVLNMHLATNGLLLIPLGLVFSVIYYIVFKFMIEKFNIETPGRMEEISDDVDNAIADKGVASVAIEYFNLLGGHDNIVEVDSCITRLRLTLKDNSHIEDGPLKKLGAAGVIKPNSKNMQVVVGTHAELIAEEMKKMLG
ncbi:N-acetylglucosamine-specific PTS transporter subunit IIBC [Fusibacter sp. JL216-2]|uniref:N-acetylglucosamine-specific PTS transporter subunit IIBC n=1 Tax=Fusibacter sp. JL216-2 TaxID=3071453 RepID=UPI003D349A8A